MSTGKGFKSLTRVNQAVEGFLKTINPFEEKEHAHLRDSLFRVASEEIQSPRHLPHYRRAAMDGYAVNARQTNGASPSSPVRVEIDDTDSAHSVAPVSTGDPLPPESDAVIKIEDCEVRGSDLYLQRNITPFTNVGEVGEDIKKNQTILHLNQMIGPDHLGLARSVGVEKIPVWKKPRVAVIPTGEELIEPGQQPGPGQVIDSNNIMLRHLVEYWGGNPEIHPLYTDEPEKISDALSKVRNCELILFVGGSSVGDRDHVVEVVRENGTVLTHGVAMHPGKPVATAIVRGVPVLCLPGYPVATMVDAMYFAKPAIRKLAHLPEMKHHTKQAPLTSKIESKLGERSIVRARLEQDRITPTRSKGAGVLSSITRSSGYIEIPEDIEGLQKGEQAILHPWPGRPLI